MCTQALRATFREDIPVCFFSFGGWFNGLSEGLPSKNVELRRQQVLASVRGYVHTPTAMVDSKIRTCRTLLRRNTRDENDGPAPVLNSLVALAEQATTATRIDELLGIQGTAARLYFEHFTGVIRPDLREAYAAVGPSNAPADRPRTRSTRCCRTATRSSPRT